MGWDTERLRVYRGTGYLRLRVREWVEEEGIWGVWVWGRLRGEYTDEYSVEGNW
jgi:hypothetical protein